MKQHNNAYLRYLLFFLVLFIWGIIAYKVITGVSGDSYVLVPPVHKPVRKVETDTFYQLLTEKYPDPFLEHPLLEDTVNELPAEEEYRHLPAKEASEKAPAAIASHSGADELPAIKYNGYIFNPVTKKKLALITYVGRSMIVGVSDKLDDKLRILRIDSGELVVIFNGKKITIVAHG